MGQKPLLGAFVVIRRDRQQGVDPEGGRFPGRPDRTGGVVAAHAGDQLCPAAAEADAVGQERKGLGGLQGRGLPRRAANQERLYPGLQLGLQEPVKGGKIDFFAPERGDKGGTGTAEDRCFHADIPPFPEKSMPGMGGIFRSGAS